MLFTLSVSATATLPNEAVVADEPLISLPNSTSPLPFFEIFGLVPEPLPTIIELVPLLEPKYTPVVLEDIETLAGSNFNAFELADVFISILPEPPVEEISSVCTLPNEPVEVDEPLILFPVFVTPIENHLCL